MINQYVEFNIVKLFQSGTKFDHTILDNLDLQEPKLIPKEKKMTNFLTNDVQTYVRELISNEFDSGNKEEKAHSENRKSINSEHQKQQKQTAVFSQKLKE
jgi:hypothetical protein